MPTIIPGYAYSLFAALIVGTIIVSSCSLSVANIKNQAANQQLKNIDEYVAAQSLTLLSQTNEDDQNTTQSLDIPSQVGNQIFWIHLANDSSGVWIESGFGTIVTSSEIHINIPATVMVSGIFISGSGRAVLQCHFENQTATLKLTKEG
jgi:hypothetical protein